MPNLTEKYLHEQMVLVQEDITAALERAGYEPCPAIDLGYAAVQKAWDVWNLYAERVRALEDALAEIACDSRFGPVCDWKCREIARKALAGGGE